eukprot:11950310-Alexandrium_andersonii.AAC.1
MLAQLLALLAKVAPPRNPPQTRQGQAPGSSAGPVAFLCGCVIAGPRASVRWKTSAIAPCRRPH